MSATAAQEAITLRPMPPGHMLEQFAADEFVPALRMASFVERTLLNEESPLWNPDHAHLLGASIGFLWTNVPLKRQQRDIAATAEMPKPPMAGNAWAKAKWAVQMRGWLFDPDATDFLITIDANYANQADDVLFCALIDHELYHCAQKMDEFGGPKFTKDGQPVYGLIGHEVEEFVGIVRRYGAGAGAGMTAQLVEASSWPAEIADVDIRAICGSCA